MPTITPGDKVLVSGANGFIASWVVGTLLEQGYAVRGTVRSLGKGRHLTELFQNYGDRSQLAVVENIMMEGAFDEAVKGVDAIVHTASPCYTNADDPQELIKPALRGTLSILQSALKHGSTIKRVVVTSSTATILETLPSPRVLSKLDWNNQALKEVEEKAAWDFLEKNKNKISWDLTVIIPPYVFGPAIHEVSTVNGLNESLLQWHNNVLVDGKTDTELKQASSWVDVRDLTEAHVRALKEEKAGGERIIVSAGPFVWQHWVNVARCINPSIPPGHSEVVPKSDSDYMIRYDTAKAARILKIAPKGTGGEITYYKSMEETARDILADFSRRGW